MREHAAVGAGLSDAQAVDLLEAALRVPSPCGKEDAMADLLLEAMAGSGFAARRDEVGNVAGTIGDPGGKRVVILGHMDTVPGVVPVERRDGALYGRGAVDAKGPLAAAVVAAGRARTRCSVTVIGAVQEEGPSVGARYLARQPAPDYLVIGEPSGWDSVVLGYRGSQRFTVELARPAGHTAGPEMTAPQRLVTFWNDLVRLCGDVGPGAGNADSLTATLISMASHHDGMSDVASLHIGLRLPPGITPEEIQSQVTALLPEAEFAFAPGEPAVRGPKSGPLVAAFLRAIRGEGAAPRFKVKTGTSDMNVVGPAWGCPMLAYGPGDSRLDHTPTEHVEIDEYLRAIRILTAVLEDL